MELSAIMIAWLSIAWLSRLGYEDYKKPSKRSYLDDYDFE